MGEIGFWGVVILVFGAAFVVGVGIGLIFFLRHTLTELIITRNSLTVRTNNDSIQLEIAGRLERIDSDTRRAIRKKTTELELLDTKKHGTSFEVLAVNMVANQPLVHSAYENHHTRELKKALGADQYIGVVAIEIWKAVKQWKSDVLDLNEKMVEDYACRWVQTAIIPKVKAACEEKLIYYGHLLARNDISESIKIHIRSWISKNKEYLEDLTELDGRSRIIQEEK